jgi:SAM-dependent methyltransferase
MVKLDPPGTFCLHQAVCELLEEAGAATFADVGCGGGGFSSKLLARGMTGVGVDSSAPATAECERNLASFIQKGSYRLLKGELGSIRPDVQYDAACSLMVMEHVPDDVGFVRRLASSTRPGGSVIVAVPARKSKWDFEDETVGHLRRYERADLFRLLTEAGLEDVRVRSVGVPIVNILWSVTNFLVRRSGESRKTSLDKAVQTETSGIREIPFKTTFPPIFRLVLNSVALYPFFVVQRLFYRTDLGLTMIAAGRKPVA